MLMKSLAALAAACAAFAVSVSEPAMADGMPSVSAPRKVVKAVSHAPRRYATHRYVRGPWPGGPDPYAYSYGKQGYYPYYNSKYWVPRKQMIGRTKYPMRVPQYASSWGYPLSCKLSGHRHCGVPFRSKAGDISHYYERNVQLPARRHYH